MSAETRVQVKPASPPPSATPVAKGLLQRKCACGGSPGAGGECADCQKKKLDLQRKESGAAGPATALPIVHEVLSSPGRPLDREVRSMMEPRFGHDFSRVRVHTDSRAAESAQAVSAIAYTVGRDVVFARGAYAPESGEGRKLLAHELTHVVQQSGATLGTSLRLDGPGYQALEEEAEIRARQVVEPTQGSDVRARAGLFQVQRQQPPAPSGASPTVYMCAKDLAQSPVGRHAFFRIGGANAGRPTYSLEPQDNNLMNHGEGWGAGCYQGVPVRDFAEDVNAVADCDATAIDLSCLEREHAAYPIGLYCTLGPNSNTYVGHLARACGVSDPDPTGWTPGIDDNPPADGTYSPSPTFTLVAGCQEKLCGRGM